jgi:hypothetical protein
VTHSWFKEIEKVITDKFAFYVDIWSSYSYLWQIISIAWEINIILIPVEQVIISLLILQLMKISQATLWWMIPLLLLITISPLRKTSSLVALSMKSTPHADKKNNTRVPGSKNAQASLSSTLQQQKQEQQQAPVLHMPTTRTRDDSSRLLLYDKNPGGIEACEAIHQHIRETDTVVEGEAATDITDTSTSIAKATAKTTNVHCCAPQ